MTWLIWEERDSFGCVESDGEEKGEELCVCVCVGEGEWGDRCIYEGDGSRGRGAVGGKRRDWIGEEDPPIFAYELGDIADALECKGGYIL